MSDSRMCECAKDGSGIHSCALPSSGFTPYSHPGAGTDQYMCPFCVTPWKCNGPHIPDDDLDSFNDAMLQSFKDGRASARTHSHSATDLALRELHYRYQPYLHKTPLCHGCGARWPCPEGRILWEVEA
jgi:hypothetical protein